MKALISSEPGGPETLTIADLPDPEPGPGEVLIDVHAAGVNYPDTLIIRDLYQARPERPFVPGNEVAGIVAALGEGVENLAVGDHVAGFVGTTGGFATKAVAPALSMVKVRQFSLETAASFLLTYGTSHHALKDRAALKEGETLFILGAAGGVGSAAIELGVAMGAKVIAGVSSAEKADFARDLGAHETIVYPRGTFSDETRKAFTKAIKDASGGKGVDVIYDAVGGEYAESAFRAIAWEGRYLVVGFPAGIPKLPLNLPLLKGASVIGVFFGAATEANPEQYQTNLKELLDMAEKGIVRPRVTETFPLAEGAKAFSKLEAREATGKLVITMV